MKPRAYFPSLERLSVAINSLERREGCVAHRLEAEEHLPHTQLHLDEVAVCVSIRRGFTTADERLAVLVNHVRQVPQRVELPRREVEDVAATVRHLRDRNA